MKKPYEPDDIEDILDEEDGNVIDMAEYLATRHLYHDHSEPEESNDDDLIIPLNARVTALENNTDRLIGLMEKVLEHSSNVQKTNHMVLKTNAMLMKTLTNSAG